MSGEAVHLQHCDERCLNVRTLRRFIAITLLAVFGLPLASSLFALTPKSEANLPACCRRNGKLHCMMNMAERNSATSDKPQLQAPLDKCPYCPAVVSTGHGPTAFYQQQERGLFASMVTRPNGVPQTESRFRIARDRARGKRGPPTSADL